MNRISVIGSGFSGLSAACFAAKAGNKVTVFEKNSAIGGRARVFSEAGFTFDMGPSWYWMPDVFDRFFEQFGYTTSSFYELVKLDPGFQIIFNESETLEVPASMEELYEVFESIEKGSAAALKKYLREAAFKYEVGMGALIYKPAHSWREYMNLEVLSGIARCNVFRSVSSHVRSYFKDERLIALMEFPVLFLGAMPNQVPALYSLMNHAALSQGTYYPMGGMWKVIDAMKKLALTLDVKFYTETPVEKILVHNQLVNGVRTDTCVVNADGIIAASDYHHTEQLLNEEYRNYDSGYWEKKTFAPSSLIFYIGVSKKLPRLQHHNLFFDTDFAAHANSIYKNPEWPKDPLFYVCCPSKTDAYTAPAGMENLFILIPVASGLADETRLHEDYFRQVIGRIERYCGVSFADDIVYKKNYSISNFQNDYNAYKGNAYGLANTLRQTAVWKPSVQNKKLKNLFYAGQLTVPGPGVPPALISGQIAATGLLTYLKKQNHEIPV